MYIELKHPPVFTLSNSKCHTGALDATYWSVGAAAVVFRYLPSALDHDHTFQRVVVFNLECSLRPDNLVLR